MYVAKLIDGIFWVGFQYSDGRFDKITSYGREEDLARGAAERMNRRR